MPAPKKNPTDHEKQDGKCRHYARKDIARIGWLRAHHCGAVTTQPRGEDADQSDKTDDRHHDHRFSRWTGGLRPIDKVNPRDHDAHCQNRNQNANQGVAPAQEATNDLSIALD